MNDQVPLWAVGTGYWAKARGLPGSPGIRWAEGLPVPGSTLEGRGHLMSKYPTPPRPCVEGGEDAAETEPQLTREQMGRKASGREEGG